MSTDNLRILVVDDDPIMLKACQMLFEQKGMAVTLASSPDSARTLLALEPHDVVLVDLNYTPGVFDGHEGLAFVGELRRVRPDIGIVVFSGYSGVALAVRAMREGADDFVVKPWRNDRLIQVVTDVLNRPRRDPPSPGEPARKMTTPIVGSSAATEEIRRAVELIASRDAAVFIAGGPGMGKALIATHIHLRSRRARRAMVRLDASTMDLAEVSEAAALLADEPATRTLLLRNADQLDPRFVSRASDWLDWGVRVLSTSRTAPAALAEGVLARHGLVFRLATMEISIPDLDHREEDIVALANHYLQLFAQRHRAVAELATARLAALWRTARWTGGISQLAQLAERSVLLGQPLHQLVEHYAAARGAPASPGRVEDNIARFERKLVDDALQRHGGNVALAAKELGMSRASIYRRLKKYDG